MPTPRSSARWRRRRGRARPATPSRSPSPSTTSRGLASTGARPPSPASSAQELVALSVEHGLFFAPLGGVLLGWALDQPAPLVGGLALAGARRSPRARAGDDGLQSVVGGVQFYKATGSRVNLTHMLSLVALA